MEKKEAERKAAEKDTGSQAEARYRCGILGCDAIEHPANWCQHNETLCDLLSMGPGAEAAGKQLWDVEKDLLGLGQLDACKGGNVLACTQLGEDLLLSSKFKFLERGMEALQDLRSARHVKGCTQCFPAGTEVLMANSHTKDIETVQPGDTVLATDPLTGRTVPRKVSRLIITDGDKHFDELTITTPDGPRKLTATYEHPFWSPSAHQWVKARDLTPGTTLLSTNGTTVSVQANQAFDQRTRTYNLTVEELHTYYVMAGATPVLVHNSLCTPLDVDLATAEAANPLIDSLRKTGKLPSNYVTKTQAEAAGWEPGKALGNKIPGAQMGGDVFENLDGLLPPAPGRTWYEADVGIDNMMKRSKQPGTRLVYSNDGLAYVTNDHYKSFYQLPNWK
ncbi:polymorphic toxin-type HINT domain-containing protein [Streptomyces sp. NPDC001215]